MSDFLDTYGEQLRGAERALAAGARPRRRPRLRARRSLVLALAGAAIAVPALAATQPWQPILGEPAHHDTPSGISATAPPADQLAALAVLRRAQDDRDRSETAQALLRFVGVDFHGVRTAYMRLLTSSTGQAAVLVPAEAIVDPSRGSVERTDALCLALRNGFVCGGTQELLSGRIQCGCNTDVLGLVPDSVRKVVLRYPSGRTVTAEVQDNFFDVPNAISFERNTRPNEPELRATARPTVEWLDAGGNVIRSRPE
jgi:hypothetical protein